MAVASRKSGAITNRDASPPVINNARLTGARPIVAVGTLETVSGDDIASVYRMIQVPSNARMHDLLLFSDDIGTTTIADIGLYRTTADGGAVVDADFFGSAVSLKDGALNGVDVLHESAVYGLEDIEKTIWEGLGLSADPMIDYDIALTLTAAADAAATVQLKAMWVV